MTFLRSLLILIWNRDSPASNPVFSTPMWLIFSHLRACHCNEVSTVFLVSFITIPSINVILSQTVQYGCTSSQTSVLIDSQPFITYMVTAFMLSSAKVICLLYSATMHCGMSVHVSVTLMFRFTPVISSSLPSL